MGIALDPTVTTVLSIIGWAVFWHVYHGLGITLGYHRLLTHKSLVVPNWLKYLICSGAYFGLMGSPIVWVGVHRQHHQKSDQPGDPHSPRDGFWHAMYKWMFYTDRVQSNEELQRQAADLMKDPLFRKLGCEHSAYQAQLCLFWCIVFRLLILAVLGWQAFVGSLIGSFTIFWSTQFVNTFCHLSQFGYQTYKTTEDSQNVWWVGLLALGEGWHNNHHAIPKSARHGLAWWEFDLTWCAIWLLEKLGLAQRVIRPSQKYLETKRIKLIEEAQAAVAAAVRDAAEAARSAQAAAAEAAKAAQVAAGEAAGVAHAAARNAAESAQAKAREAAELAQAKAREAAEAAQHAAREAKAAAQAVAREAVEVAREAAEGAQAAAREAAEVAQAAAREAAILAGKEPAAEVVTVNQ
ncbi:MAG TPA: acyl-CoA desaturase [Candidatus Obscuribacterales bacterium]